jgi:hypothetical protein
MLILHAFKSVLIISTIGGFILSVTPQLLLVQGAFVPTTVVPTSTRTHVISPIATRVIATSTTNRSTQCSYQNRNLNLNQKHVAVLSATTGNTEIEIEKEFDIEIISEDPKCFLIHNMLSPQECEEYIARANYEIEKSTSENDDSENENENENNNNNNNNMSQSNAPTVSLQLSRLWPLPFLCLGAGIPPVIRLFLDNANESTSTSTSTSIIGLSDIITTAIPNISLATIITILFTIIITKGMEQYANKYTRTSQSIALNQKSDIKFINNLVSNASKITNHNWYQWEAPVITKYDIGSLFASHNDASPTKGSEWSDIGGQRIVTVITYLNTCIDENGGGTKFDKLNFIVQPKQGSALVFYPADKDTLEADGRTVHQSLPAVEEKYIVQLFGRCERVPSPLGIPDSFGEL